MQINLTFDASVQNQSFPTAFRQIFQSAANMLDAAFTDNITVNIEVGYGELPGPGGGTMANGLAVGVPASGGSQSYSDTLSLLTTHDSGDVLSGVNALPMGSSVQGQSQVDMSLAEAKAIGLVSATAPGFDGYVGVGNSPEPTDLFPMALAAITEAMGRVAGGPAPHVFDLFRYTSPGTLLFSNAIPSTAAYLSLDGGATDLVDYAINSDPSNILGNGSQDAFVGLDQGGTFQFLTRIDLLQMETLGFHAASRPVGDFHGAGVGDILWRNDSGGVALWNSGVGAGPDQSGQFLGTLDPSWQVQQVGDFNGDGQADILWRNTSTHDVQLWYSIPGELGYFSQVQDLGVIAPSWHIEASGDFSGSGPDQILWRNDSGDVALWTGEPTTYSSESFTYQDLGVASTDWQIAGVGDFNSDGKTDVVWRNSTTGDVGLWNSVPGAGTVSFTYQDLGAVQSAWVIQGVGDFNGDGKPDILWRDTITNDIGLWINNGSGGFTYEDLGPVDPAWHVQEVSDFNGDGKADILWRNDSGDVGWWSAGPSGSTVTFSEHSLNSAATSWHIQSDWLGT